MTRNTRPKCTTSSPASNRRDCIRPRVKFRGFPAALALACFLLPAAAQTLPAPSAPDPREQEIIARIDASVHSREESLLGYTVKERYSLYRNGEDKPSAELTVQEIYKQGVGKDFTPISHSGSDFFRAAVLEKVVAGEKEMAVASIRDTVVVTSANYQMHPEPASIQQNVQVNGHACLIVDLKPRRKSPHLFNGKAWIDASDFSVVRLEGTPSQSVSFFAGDTTVARDYARINGLSMAVHAEAKSHSFLLGNSVLKIESTEYQIQRAPEAEAISSQRPRY